MGSRSYRLKEVTEQGGREPTASGKAEPTSTFPRSLARWQTKNSLGCSDTPRPRAGLALDWDRTGSWGLGEHRARVNRPIKPSGRVRCCVPVAGSRRGRHSSDLSTRMRKLSRHDPSEAQVQLIRPLHQPVQELPRRPLGLVPRSLVDQRSGDRLRPSDRASNVSGCSCGQFILGTVPADLSSVLIRLCRVFLCPLLRTMARRSTLSSTRPSFLSPAVRASSALSPRQYDAG